MATDGALADLCCAGVEAGAVDGEEGEDTAKFEPTIAEMELFKQRLGIKSTLPVMGRPVTPSAGQNGGEGRRGGAKQSAAVD